MARDGDLVLSAPDAEAEFAPLVVFDIEPPQPIPDMEAAPTVIETMAGTVVVRLDGTTPAGMSMLNKWITAHRDTDVVSKEDLELAKKKDRLRRENRILREERDNLKGHQVLCGPKAMRFRIVEEQRASFPAIRLCGVVGVSARGLRALRSRPASRRQRSEPSRLELNLPSLV